VTSQAGQQVAACWLEVRMNIASCIDAVDLNKDGISKRLLAHLYLSSTIEGAASQLGVGVTALKKRCRQLGIKRWPHRQLRSMLNMIKGLKAMLAHGDDDKCIEDAIRQIEHHVDCIVQDPSYEIPKNVFRLRQAQFKDKHNAKRRTAGDDIE